jgi:hypothetical protein
MAATTIDEDARDDHAPNWERAFAIPDPGYTPPTLFSEQTGRLIPGRFSFDRVSAARDSEIAAGAS